MTIQEEMREEGVSPARMTVKRLVPPVWLAALAGAAVLTGTICQLHIGLLITSVVVSVVFTVTNCIFLYRLWQLAQMSDLGIKKPSPVKAICFSFIPFFNFYWMFILYRNLALHLNHLTSRNKIPVTFVTVGIALVVSSVLALAGLVIILIVNFYFYKAGLELFEGRQKARVERAATHEDWFVEYTGK